MKESDPQSQILVVDDTPENVDVLAGILSGQYRLKVALNGAKALELAHGDPPPDLILLDVMMPEMDGYEVCRRLREDPATRDIPVIFVTAKTEVEDETKGFELGAVDYITKPVSPAIVRARVRTHLALKESRRRLEELSRKLGRYLPAQVYQSIFEGRQDARIGGTRKKLTVFMSDIVGFTSQTESLEPEELVFLLNSYLDRMARTVLAHGGTLDKFIGDAILVFFGDPESRGEKEDALACVKMALAMKAEIEALRRMWREKGLASSLEVRMGIASGYCTVGNFGSAQRMDYTIIGNQVNLAARLQSAAAPGEVLLSQDAYALVQDAVACVAKEAIQVKGFVQPVPVYQVVDLRERLTEGDRVADQRTGFSLELDPSAVPEAERAEVIARLQAALASLR